MGGSNAPSKAYPLTHLKAVYDDAGKNLYDILTEIQSSITDLSNKLTPVPVEMLFGDGLNIGTGNTFAYRIGNIVVFSFLFNTTKELSTQSIIVTFKDTIAIQRYDFGGYTINDIIYDFCIIGGRGYMDLNGETIPKSDNWVFCNGAFVCN